jgi:hypothetical protein
VPISFWKRNQNVLVSFLNLSCWEQIRSGLKSALLDQIELCSFDRADSGTNSDILVSFLLDVGMFMECGLFAERLLLYCSMTLPNPQYPHSQNLNSAIIKFIFTLLKYCTTKQILLSFIILMFLFLIFNIFLVSSVKKFNPSWTISTLSGRFECSYITVLNMTGTSFFDPVMYSNL